MERPYHQVRRCGGVNLSDKVCLYDSFRDTGLSMAGTEPHQYLSHHQLRDAVNEQTSEKRAGEGAGCGSLPKAALLGHTGR